MQHAPIRVEIPWPGQLWLADLSARPAGARLAVLSPEECARAARFVFERDRDRYLAAHVVLRELIASTAGRLAADLRFSAGAEGKPRLQGAQGRAFNLSHSADRAAILIADPAFAGEVGVDLEHLRPLPDMDLLARQHFTPGEQSELAATPPHHRVEAFLRGWTRKEACLKALGTGLSLAPSTFECGLAPDTRVVDIAVGAAVWSVEVVSMPVAAPLVCALARIQQPAACRRPQMKRPPCSLRSPPPEGARQRLRAAGRPDMETMEA